MNLASMLPKYISQYTLTTTLLCMRSAFARNTQASSGVKQTLSCLRRATFGIIILFVVQACTTKGLLEDQAVLALNNNLATLQNWQLRGKIAWVTPQERKSAYINWQQREQNMQFTLSNVLGINLATLNYDGELATLVADDQTYSDPSPSRLIYQTTGWSVPILPLSSWIKGAASTNGREYLSSGNGDVLQKGFKQRIIRFENGLIKQLIPQCAGCDAWQIDYKRYQAVVIKQVEYQLPTDISLTNLKSNATIKIRVNEWRP